MRLIDSHLHLWDPRRLHYGWLDAMPDLNRPWLPEHIGAEALCPDAAIVVQADCDPAQALEEVRWINALASRSPFRIAGIVAWAPLEQGEGVISFLRQLQALPHVVGIRRSLQNEPDTLLYDAHYRRGVLAAAQAGLAIDLCVRAKQLPAVQSLLDWLYSHMPTARVVLDHLGKPGMTSDTWAAWHSDIGVLSTFPRLHCKISGLPTEADWLTWRDEHLTPWIEHALDRFGPGRCLFGGDWPVVNLAGGYGRWHNCVRKAIAPLPPGDQQAIWSGTAQAFYLQRSP